MQLFFDSCVARAMADAVASLARAQRIEVVHLTQEFAPSTPDVEWITALRGRDVVLVSGDTRITRNPVERAAWQESGLTAFFLDDGWASKKFWVQAGELVRWCPVIIDTARTCAQGSGYRLPFKGTEPKLIYTPPQA